jgi:hypothetical protein
MVDGLPPPVTLTAAGPVSIAALNPLLPVKELTKAEIRAKRKLERPPREGRAHAKLKPGAKNKTKIDLLTDMAWVYNNIGTDNLELNNCPSQGAWSWLWRLRKDPDLLSDFYRTCLPKLIPSKTVLENESKNIDDGERVLGLLSRTAKEHSAAGNPQPIPADGSKDPVGKPEIPRESY